MIYIPIINLFLLFHWLFYKAKKLRTPDNEIRKTLFTVMIVFVLINLPRVFFSMLENDLLDTILLWICVYLSGVAFGLLITRTENIQIKKKEKEDESYKKLDQLIQKYKNEK